MKSKKKNTYATLLTTYRDPTAPGSLGGVARFARAQKLPIGKVRKTLERDLGYTLHKPRRRHFPTLPVMVFGIDEQWAADLIEVINIAKSNRGYRYLLTVIDVFSKYTWVEPVKTKSGQDVTIAFEKILKQSEGRQPQKLWVFKKGYLPGWTEEVFIVSRASLEVWSLTELKRWMTHLWKAPFILRTYRKSPSRTTICIEWKKC